VDNKPSEEKKETPSEQNSDASKAEENEAN
jgi:hypothetical protein